MPLTTHFFTTNDLHGMVRVMSSSLLISDLLERYMKERGYTEHWLTVQELRTWFSQDCPSGQALSGFLGRNHNGAFAACRYKVTRIEKFRDTIPPYRIIRRYLVRERPVRQNHARQGHMNEKTAPVRLLYHNGHNLSGSVR
jgi:hypothetical protein